MEMDGLTLLNRVLAAIDREYERCEDDVEASIMNDKWSYPEAVATGAARVRNAARRALADP